MSGAIGLVESAWFFRRGRQYVRIVRVDRKQAGLSLMIDGPGAAHTAHHFHDSMSCAIHQCELERELVTRDFHLERVTGMKPSARLPMLTIPAAHPRPTGPAAA
jgi:hypothetical protein